MLDFVCESFVNPPAMLRVLINCCACLSALVYVCLPARKPLCPDRTHASWHGACRPCMECNRLAPSDVEMQRMVEVMMRSMQMGTLASMFTQLGVGDLKWPPSNVSFPQSC